MSISPTITVDSRQAIARFSDAGIPQKVRQQLATLLPNLGKRFAGRVDSKLDSELKSRTHLVTDVKMRENPSTITVTVSVKWTGDKKANMVPQVLDTGARPHRIEAVNAKALAFFWPKMGSQVFFKGVNHPGFPGLRYMERTLNEMNDDILLTLKRGVIEAANQWP